MNNGGIHLWRGGVKNSKEEKSVEENSWFGAEMR